MMKITNVTELAVNPVALPENGKTDEGFARELDKVTEQKADAAEENPETVKEPEGSEDEGKVKDSEKLPEENTETQDGQQGTTQAGIIAAVAVVTALPQTAPKQDAQAVEAIPEAVLAAEKEQPPRIQRQEPPVVVTETADGLDKMTEATGKRALKPDSPTPQATVTVSKEAEPFVRQALGEAEALVRRQAAQTGKTEQAPVAESARQRETPFDGAGESAGREKQEKHGGEKTVAHTPVTANVTKEGKVEFRLANTRQPEFEQVRQKEELLPKLIDQIKSTVTKEKTEFFLQLKPEHLGGLSILLSSEEKGIVAKLMTSSRDVQQVMQSDMASMQAALREKGINVVQMDVIYGQTTDSAARDGDGGARQWNEAKGNGQGGPQESIDSATAFYDNLSYYDVLAEQGGSVEFSA